MNTFIIIIMVIMCLMTMFGGLHMLTIPVRKETTPIEGWIYAFSGMLLFATSLFGGATTYMLYTGGL